MRPQVDGKLIAVNFIEGQDVKKGDVLGEIDPAIYKAQYDQAVAKKAQDEAQLANQRLDLIRYQQLAAANAGSKQQADTQRAVVAQQEALVNADQAAIDNAQATLGYTKIIAPLSGRTGLRQVDQGNIIHAADATGLAVITQLQPIAVQFSLPQQQIMRVNAASAKGALAVDVFGNDGVTVVDTGKLTGIDNQVDPTTGTLKLKAEFPKANSSSGRASSSMCGSRSTRCRRRWWCRPRRCSAGRPAPSAMSSATTIWSRRNRSR